MFAALTHNILLQMKKVLSLLLTGIVLTFFSCQQDFESEFESLNGMGDDEEVLAQPRTSMSVASSKKTCVHASGFCTGVDKRQSVC